VRAVAAEGIADIGEKFSVRRPSGEKSEQACATPEPLNLAFQFGRVPGEQDAGVIAASFDWVPRMDPAENPERLSGAGGPFHASPR